MTIFDDVTGTNTPYRCTGVQVRVIEDCSKGLDYLLGLFGNQMQLFPRTVATKSTRGRQTIINSREEALEYFKAANFEDCRISAYPYWRPSIVSDFAGIKNPIAPDIIMIDLDLCNYGSMESLDKVLKDTLKRIKCRLLDNGNITVIWSGNGYHIYLPINAVILENVQEFQTIEEPSIKFLRFAEWYLSDGKSDAVHNGTVSFNNCMMRVPGTINSKSNEDNQVRIIIPAIIHDKDKIPNMKSLIGSFYVHVKESELKEKEKLVSSWNINLPESGLDKVPSTISWIETLLQTPLDDHRKFAVWMILPQYLMNVRRLSYELSNNIIKEWLDKCAKLKRLDSAATKQKLKAGFEAADRGFRPMSMEKMRVWKPELYALLFST